MLYYLIVRQVPTRGKMFDNDRIDRRDRNLARRAMSDCVFPAVTSRGAKFSDRQPRQSDLSSGFRREMRVAPPLYVRETTISYVFSNRLCLCTYSAVSTDAGVLRFREHCADLRPVPSISCYLFRSSRWMVFPRYHERGGGRVAAIFSRKYTCRRWGLIAFMQH